MWYQKAFRRHIYDMHINDWDPVFLSKFSAEQYVKNLKAARIKHAEIYLQSHVGLCYYPTKSGQMHKAFEGKEDTMRQLIDLCHAEGIYVTAYYSLIYNTLEHDRHPEWRMVYPNGKSMRENNAEKSEMHCTAASVKASRYGLCCPNNMEHREFLKLQIKEIAEYVPTVDGFFYDMLFWPHLCYCDSCKARWEKEVGGEIPTLEDWKDERWLLHIHKRREWMGEFAQWASDYTKSLLPHVSVTNNTVCAIHAHSTKSTAEETVNAADYISGDLYNGCYEQSFACKFFQNSTKNRPFEYCFARCAPTLSSHTQIKSNDMIKSAVFLTAAHHGATKIIDAIDPVGTMDSRVYDIIGKVFDELIPYEPYLVGEMIEDIGIYYSMKSRFNPDKEVFTNHLGSITANETLVSKHIPFGVTGGYHDIGKYKMIIASCLTDEDAYDNKRLINYVKDGGILYISGGNCKKLLGNLFGVQITGRTAESVTYISPKEKVQNIFDYFNEDYPLHFDGTAPIAEGFDEADVMATVTLPYTSQKELRFASIHSNPPGIKTNIPALVIKDVGRGKVVWSALPIECVSFYCYRDIFTNLIQSVSALEPTFSSDAPEDVEITAFETEDSILLNTVIISNKSKIRKTPPFTVNLKCGKAVTSVKLLHTKKEIEFTADGDSISFTVDNMHIFNMYEIKF